MKEQKGITLIALVITIIVLLILAGVTIAMVLGQDGIFQKAEEAKEKTTVSQERELISLSMANIKTENLENMIVGEEEVKASQLESELTSKGYTATVTGSKADGTGTLTVKFIGSGNIYTVTQEGKVTGPTGGEIEPPDIPTDPTEVWYKIEDKTVYLSNSDLGGYTKNASEEPGWLDFLTENINNPTTKVIMKNKIAPTSTYAWFALCGEIGSEINGEYRPNDLSNLNTSNVTNMNMMFYGYYGMTKLDLRNFNTSKVTNMATMFGGSGITDLDVSSFDTSNVTNMEGMFSSCSNLVNLNLSNFNTSKVTNMQNMFANCEKLTNLEVSNFDTSNVTSMVSMFYNCTSLTRLDLISFDTSNVSSKANMFSNVTCPVLVGVDWTLDERQTAYNGTFERE